MKYELLLRCGNCGNCQNESFPKGTPWKECVITCRNCLCKSDEVDFYRESFLNQSFGKGGIIEKRTESGELFYVPATNPKEKPV